MYPTNVIAREFDKKEKTEANKLQKAKLKIPFIIEHFVLQYGLTRYDTNTGILSVPYRVETKHSEDGIEDRFFKKYWDIIIAEVLDEQQLVKKRKMQLELSQDFSLLSRQGVLNIILKNRILFPFYFRRYWMKMTYDRFDMKYVLSDPQAITNLMNSVGPIQPPVQSQILEQTMPDSVTPVLVVEGVLHVSIKHFTRDLLRYNFCNITTIASPIQKSPAELFIEFIYKLPNLFVRFNAPKTQEEMLRFIKEDFDGLERFKHFWHFKIKSLYGTPIINPIIEWVGEKSIKIISQEKLNKILNKGKKLSRGVLTTIALVDQLNTYRKVKKASKKKKPKKK